MNIPDFDKLQLDNIYDVCATLADGVCVYVCDMRYDYSRWDEGFAATFGMPGPYMYNAGTMWSMRVHRDDRAAYKQMLADVWNGTKTSFELQYRAKRFDEAYDVCTGKGAIIYDDDGKQRYFVGFVKTQDEKKRIDDITALRNQYGFFDDLRMILYKQEKCIIAMVGINNFSEINDVYGYSFGNRVLQRFARMLNEALLDNGIVYRLDGAKFALIVDGVDKKAYNMYYKQLVELARTNFIVDDIMISLTINGGFVCMDHFDSYDISEETIYSCLKYAYYESKNMSQGNLVEFKNEVSDSNRHALERLTVIRNSVMSDCSGFYMVYQPVVDAKTGKLHGAEALIRFKNDDYGYVAPDVFIPFLEKDSCFYMLGRWIVETSLRDGLKILEKQPDFVLNINLSYAQIEKVGFLEDFFEILHRVGFPPNNLCLEITERCRLLDVGLLQNVMVVLNAHGIKVALDDFGTGFSSLGLMKEIPIDVVKIDREFVKDVVDSLLQQRLVGVICDLASVYGSSVCVEGIETEKQRLILMDYSVDYIQGYLYSKPLELEQFIERMPFKR